MIRDRAQRERDRLALARARRRARSGGFGLPLFVNQVASEEGGGGPVAVVSDITPSAGNDRGGTSVVIEVDDSTGCTGASVGGVALTSFAIDDATHVSGVTGAHARGQVDVTVTNGGGTSSPLVNGYEYLDALSFSTCRTWHRADLGVTLDGSNNVQSWADQSGAGDSNRNFSQGTSGNRPGFSATNANFNNRPTVNPDGTDDYLVSGTFSGGPYAQPITIYAVVRFPTNALAFLLDDLDGSGRIAVLSTGSDDPYVHAGLDLTGSGNDYVANTTHVICVVFNGASSAVYINRWNTASASGNTGSGALKAMTLFSRFNLISFFGGSCSELITYSGAHASGTRELVMNKYLGDAYGVSVTS